LRDGNAFHEDNEPKAASLSAFNADEVLENIKLGKVMFWIPFISSILPGNGTC
jgi:hypothetical protein